MSTDRLIFRKSSKVGIGIATKADLPFILQNANDLEINRFLAHGRFPIGEAFELKWLEHLYEEKVPSNLTFSVVTLDDMKMVGLMGLHSINFINRTATTGAWLAPESCGKKIGREAKMVLLRYAFIELGLRTIRSNVIAYNPRSHRYLLATGYKEIGRAFAWHRNPLTGEFADEILVQLMQEDWLPLYEKWRTENGE